MNKTVVSLAAAAFISTGASAAADASELYTVKQGDTLFSIANKYKITVVQLMEMNDLQSDKLAINDRLIILEEGQTQQTAVTKASAAVKTKEAVIVSAAASSYKVKSGDSLGLIASRYKTSVASLKQLNGLTSDFIYAGQTLKVNGTAPSSAKKVPASQTVKSKATGSYTVKSGDSLSSIASLHKISIASLKQLNGLTSNFIYAGQALKVSGQAVKTTSSKTTKTPSVSTAGGTYTVKSGDSLSRIASLYKTSIASLKQLNGLTSDFIYVGQKLNVSGQAVKTAAPAQTNQPSPSTASGTYIVKSGDSLSSIASNHDMTISALKQMNSLTTTIIFAGQKLKVAAGAKPAASPIKVSNPSSSGGYTVSTLISTASSLAGIPYVWGGASPSGFDCSGFIYYAYKQAGKSMSRTNTEGYFNRSYEVSNPVPGDLVFFSNTYKKGISHMGIYIGENQFIHASSSSGVAVTSLSNPYFKSKFTSFKRFY